MTVPAGYRDAERQELSDYTCTALQLANFWQDVRRDYDIGRIYIPLDEMAAAGYSEDDLQAQRYNERFAGLLRSLVARTWALFRKGLPLVERVDPRAAKDMKANDEFEAGEKKEKISIRNDILGQIDGPLTISVGLKKPYGNSSIRNSGWKISWANRRR